MIVWKTETCSSHPLFFHSWSALNVSFFNCLLFSLKRIEPKINMAETTPAEHEALPEPPAADGIDRAAAAIAEAAADAPAAAAVDDSTAPAPATETSEGATSEQPPQKDVPPTEPGAAAVPSVAAQQPAATLSDADVAAALAKEPQQAKSLPILFTARPDGFQFLEMFAPASPGTILYNRLEKLFHIQRRNMRLYWEGRPISDIDVVADICAMPEDSGEALMLELEFDVLPHHLRVLGPGDRALRSVNIDVAYGEGIPNKLFYVTLVKGFDRKPFLGGYRDKRSSLHYHHAATQTQQVDRAAELARMNAEFSRKCTRMTQTQGKTRSCQTMREGCTQMARSDLLVDSTFDRIVIAKPYFSADELDVVRAEKAIKLQAFVRGWRARKQANVMRDERFAELSALEAEDRRRRQVHAQRRKVELERRMHPRTAKDFQVLHNELEAWRLQEVQRIDNADLSAEERRLAMQELLKKETKLLQTIDRLQIQAGHENRAENVNKRLEQMASAKKWGTTTTVDVETPCTVRARELRDLYNGLLLSGLTIDERLDVLLHAKWTVKEFDCPLTRDIVELIDREADLLNRGRKEATLNSLRQRVANLFLQFVETPEFNPEAAHVQTVPLEFKSRPLVQLSRK